MLKKLFIAASTTALILALTALAAINWISKFTPSQQEVEKLKATQASDIPYLQNPIMPGRGKILAVVTSVKTLGKTGRPTGYELTELARAYWIFYANGFEVDIASPEGGEPYALLDDEDMAAYDYAFLNDPVAQYKKANTLKISEVDASSYQAIYFVGGKGAMFDFPNNKTIIDLVNQFSVQHKIIAAVCHGPAAFINVKTPDGRWFVANKRISAFTDSEELLLMPNAETIFPFLLQRKLEERGANFIPGVDYLEQVSVDHRLVTGQNPWSVWRVAEETIKLLGYEPAARAITPEEHSVALLKEFHKGGLSAAEKTINVNEYHHRGHLVLMHAFVAFMKWELLDGLKLIILSDSLKA
jgi:putative intracellular protease/amidase